MSSTLCFQRAGCVSSVRSVRRVQCASAKKPVAQKAETDVSSLLLLSTAIATPLMPLLTAEPALAAGGANGVLEGRTIALIHPFVMAILFGTTLYTGYLGWQWNQTRTTGDIIKLMKADLPPKDADGVRPPSSLDAEIAALELKRKTLIAGGFRDKHHTSGSILLATGTIIAIEGAVNTYLRTGKLFPGPHLWAGAGIVALWAAAAAFTPAMQKGSEGARAAHITLNSINVLLFMWQLPTGLDIVYKVFQFTSWP